MDFDFGNYLNHKFIGFIEFIGLLLFSIFFKYYLFDQHTLIDIDTGISKAFKGIVLNYSFNHPIKIPDALIAATAIHLGIPLYSYNKKDFDFIPEIKFYKTQ